jgi:hypothetical protein
MLTTFDDAISIQVKPRLHNISEASSSPHSNTTAKKIPDRNTLVIAASLAVIPMVSMYHAVELDVSMDLIKA